MKLRNILHRLQKLSEDELSADACAYNPFYGRMFKIEAFGSITHTASEDVESEHHRKVFVLAQGAVR